MDARNQAGLPAWVTVCGYSARCRRRHFGALGWCQTRPLRGPKVQYGRPKGLLRSTIPNNVDDVGQEPMPPNSALPSTATPGRPSMRPLLAPRRDAPELGLPRRHLDGTGMGWAWDGMGLPQVEEGPGWHVGWMGWAGMGCGMGWGPATYTHTLARTRTHTHHTTLVATC